MPRNLKPALKRRPEGAGYASGEDAQKRIISAALKIFSEQGYVGASTRRIAAEAEVNTPAIQYYFGNKVGLHLACANVISDAWCNNLEAELAAASEVIASQRQDRAIPALYAFLEASLDHSLKYGPATQQSRFFVRVQAEGDSPALRLVGEKVLTPILSLTRGLIALSKGRSEDDLEVQLATFAVVRLLTTFGSAIRDVDLPLPGDMPSLPIDLVKQMFRRGVGGILGFS